MATSKKLKTTAMQQSAVEYYTEPTSDTFNNWLKSMVKAGYSYKYSHRNGWQLLGKDHIIEAIEAYKGKISKGKAITVEFIQREHARLAGLAEQKGDLVNATRNLEGLGRTIAAYTDKSQVETTNAPEIEPQEQEALQEAAKVYKLRIAKTG